MWKPKWQPIFLDRNNGDKFGTNDPKKDLMDMLVNKTKTLGHILTYDEVGADGEVSVEESRGLETYLDIRKEHLLLF